MNTIEKLEQVDIEKWVEVDVRAFWNDLILNHEPFESWVLLDYFLNLYNHKFIIVNIKEAWIESRVIELLEKYNITDYFLLDVEFPYIYRATREGNRNIAIRYSEDEPIEQALLYKDKLDYLFVDTNTRLPVDKEIIKKFEWFKTCFVSPDRWGRPGDLEKYKKTLMWLWYEFDFILIWADYEYLLD